MLGQLQSGADLVGELDAIGGEEAEGGEHEMADRVGRQRAVVPKVVECLVAVGALIEPVRVDEAAQRCLWHPTGAYSRGQGNDRRHRRLVAGEKGRHVGVNEVEHGQPHAALDAGLIADVVDESGIAVNGEQVGAQLLGQEPQCHGEVFGARLREHAIERLERGRSCGHRASILLVLIECGIQPYDEGYEYRAR